MIPNVKPLKFRVGGVSIVLQPYGFDEDGIVLNAIHAVTESDHLTNCFSVIVNRVALLRFGKLLGEQLVDEAIRVAKRVHRELSAQLQQPSLPFRLVVVQLNHPDYEWDKVSTEHNLLNSESEKLTKEEEVLHINLPIHHLYRMKTPNHRIPAVKKQLAHLPHLKNTFAWMASSQWFCEDIVKLYQNFLPEATDEYQLQASLVDVTKECRSVLIKQTYQEAKLLVKNYGRESLDSAKVLEIEKQLIVYQEEILLDLRIIYEKLTSAEKAISRVEKEHTELYEIHTKVSLLRALLESDAEVPGVKWCSWGQKLMMVIIWNSLFHAVTAFNCDSGLDRTSIGFSIALAIAQLKKEYSIDRIADMAIHWDETTLALNRVIARDSAPEKLTEHQQSVLKQRTALVIQLREYVLANLQAISLPITALSSGPFEYSRREGERENSVILNFLPPFGEVQTDVNEVEMIKIVSYHPLTGEPVSLTEAGHHLLERLSYRSEDSIDAGSNKAL